MEALSTSDVERACRDYPQELVWAVHDQRRSEYLPIVVRMLDEYRDDPYLLNRVLGCIGRIGGKKDIQSALEVAGEVMTRMATAPPADEPV